MKNKRLDLLHIIILVLVRDNPKITSVRLAQSPDIAEFYPDLDAKRNDTLAKISNVLYRLSKSGLLKSSKFESDGIKTVIKLYEITQEGLEQLKYVQDLLESIPDGSEIKKSSKKEVEKSQPELVPISNPEPMDGLKPTQNLVIPDVMSAEEIAKKYKQDLMLFGMDVYRIPATRDTTKEEMQNINLLSKKVATLFAKILTKMNAK